MRAAVCNEYGPPESLEIVEMADPQPSAGEVVVEIAFAAVNYPDVLILANKYQVSAPLPFIPGSEFSGTVTAVADDVDTVAVGDLVFGSAMFGSFAERIAIPADAVRPVPTGVSLEAAAAFRVAHATSYHSLRSVAELVPGERVVVLGAAGGVGLAAVELAAIMGATVIAAASTDDKLALCRERGAEYTINYVESDMRAVLKEIMPDGVDVVIDPVGGPYAEQAFRALRRRGRFVTVGFASGEIPRIPLNLVLLKGSIIKGFEMRTFLEHEPESHARDQLELIEMLTSGQIAPHISATHVLDDVAEALNAVAERRSTGKVLLRLGASDA
jgi:NADPH2:quinone reductase